ncbi:uncharacterized protein LOC143891058 [Tasmannia lanceolata]|uniref:uncharacterized protein LOC143891058 n=1 Tax=Tasmannia lanceolata TaxID=3420 RepID=UPI004063B490
MARNLILPKSSLGLLKPSKTASGIPALFLSEEEVRKGSAPFKLALVAKCSYGRPPLYVVKESIKQKFHISVEPVVTILDQRHLLIRFGTERDFLSVWLSDNMKIQGYLLRFLRWSPDFKPGIEPPIAPVWVTLPGLPLYLFNEDYLASVGGLLGRMLKIDAPTIQGTRTEFAKICIEINIREKLHEKFWLGTPGGGGRWQKVTYEKIPKYCDHCLKFGHYELECRSKKEHESINPLKDLSMEGRVRVADVSAPDQGEKQNSGRVGKSTKA